MGCGQSRLSRRPSLHEIIRIYRHGSSKDTNNSRKILLKDDQHASSSSQSDHNIVQEAKPLPKVKVTVAPHLEDDDDEPGFNYGQEMYVKEQREQNGGFGAPRVVFKDEAMVKTMETKVEVEEEEEEDGNDGNEEDGWIGGPGSPSFRVYLVSVPSDEDDDVKDGDVGKTSLKEEESTKNKSLYKEGFDVSETKSGWKGRRFMEAVRKGRLNMTSCCNTSHQQTVPEQTRDKLY